MQEVFISYKSEEYAVASTVRKRLESDGIGCWMAPDCIEGGKSYAQQIPNAIRSAKVVVVLVSSASMSSKWVAREVDRALNEDKLVLPFVIEDVPLTDEFNFYLTNVQQYPAYFDFDGELERMMKDIRSHLGAVPEVIDAPAPSQKQSYAQQNEASRSAAAVPEAKPSNPSPSDTAASAPAEQGEAKKRYCRFLPPGFRSLNAAHIFGAILIYGLLAFICFVVIKEPIARIALIAASLVTIAFFGDYLGFRSAFGFERIKQKWLRIPLIVLTGILIFIVVSLIVIVPTVSKYL